MRKISFVLLAISKMTACLFLVLLSAYLLNSCKKQEKETAQIPELVKPTKYPGPCPYPCDDELCKAYIDYCGGTRTGVIVNYAGIAITYETTNHILKFNNVDDLNTVIDQLDADYENYNANHENQYATLTADQLDSVDQATGFDEFTTFKNFEANFSSYISKRSQYMVK